MFSVPFGPINNIAETFEHPQAVARGAIMEIDVRLKLGSPLIDQLILDPPSIPAPEK